MAVVFLLPVANGLFFDPTVGNVVIGGALVDRTRAWEAVDDPVGSPDDDTSYAAFHSSPGVESAGGRYSFVFQRPQDVGVTNIKEIQLLTLQFRSRKGAIGAGDPICTGFVSRPTPAATVQFADTFFPTTSYQDFISTWTTNPILNAPWTAADLNGGLFEFGIVRGAGGEQFIRNTQIFLKLDYTTLDWVPFPPGEDDWSTTGKATGTWGTQVVATGGWTKV